MRRGSVAALVACGALFGLSYVFVRAVVPVLGRYGALGLVAGLAGAAVFAFGAWFAARRFVGVPPLALATGQKPGATAVLAPLPQRLPAAVLGLRWRLARQHPL
ncbi:hypothetical protein [Phytohabitans kaempferiae]|uniref:Major facilitator superfamily (MFS) profile domain-containing protein n=1 Tax=Phytohabitans kaempferiae TaxID=1620943 RepID=A0ABV6LXZ4_9ACTN